MRNILINGAREMGLDADSGKIEKLIKYKDLLLEWNSKMNLTAITDPKDIAVKHFLDCMSAIPTGLVNGSVIDVGCGAGFPGLVLKIMQPQIDLLLLDSLKKRITFLEHVIGELGLDNVRAVHSRAEDAAKNSVYRAKFDTVTSRAVANMTTLSNWCIPFLKEGGYFLALKGPNAEDEVKEAKRMINILGGEILDIKDAIIPNSDLKHKLVIIKKVRQTPIKYPKKICLATKKTVKSCYNLPK